LGCRHCPLVLASQPRSGSTRTVRITASLARARLLSSLLSQSTRTLRIPCRPYWFQPTAPLSSTVKQEKFLVFFAYAHASLGTSSFGRTHPQRPTRASSDATSKGSFKGSILCGGRIRRLCFGRFVTRPVSAVRLLRQRGPRRTTALHVSLSAIVAVSHLSLCTT
jgi:hypothetical protein